MPQNKYASNGWQIGRPPIIVDASDQVLHALATFLSNLFQCSPKRIFKADAGLVTIDNDRALDDCGLHGSLAHAGQYEKGRRRNCDNDAYGRSTDWKG